MALKVILANPFNSEVKGQILTGPAQISEHVFFLLAITVMIYKMARNAALYENAW